MIRALRACLRRPRAVRLVAVVALLTFVFVLALGAAHAGEQGHSDHDRCGVCVAAGSVATAEAFAAPRLLARVAPEGVLPPRVERVPAAAAPRRSHAPRGPPALA